METMTAFPDFMSDRGLPRTPPYTPHTPKRGIPRSESPAASIHPIETVSPKKRGHKRNNTIDNVKVKELVEGDKGYTTDAEVVYPEDLEEPETGDENAMSSSSETEDIHDVTLLRKLSRLNCGDDSEVRFELGRRRRRELQRRQTPHHVKRSHSQSIQSGVETTYPELLNDHDVPSSQRRLRRRTRGPDHYAEYSPQPSPRSTPTAHLWDRHGHNLTPGILTEDEDVGGDDDGDDDDESDDDGDESENASAGNTATGRQPRPHSTIGQTRSAIEDDSMDVDSDSDEDL